MLEPAADDEYQTNNSEWLRTEDLNAPSTPYVLGDDDVNYEDLTPEPSVTSASIRSRGQSRSVSADRVSARRNRLATTDLDRNEHLPNYSRPRSQNSSPMRSNQRVYDRMYEDFFLQQEHLLHTAAIVERERQDRINQTTFRFGYSQCLYHIFLTV